MDDRFIKTHSQRYFTFPRPSLIHDIWPCTKSNQNRWILARTPNQPLAKAQPNPHFHNPQIPSPYPHSPEKPFPSSLRNKYNARFCKCASSPSKSWTAVNGHYNLRANDTAATYNNPRPCDATTVSSETNKATWYKNTNKAHVTHSPWVSTKAITHYNRSHKTSQWTAPTPSSNPTKNDPNNSKALSTILTTISVNTFSKTTTNNL